MTRYPLPSDRLDLCNPRSIGSKCPHQPSACPSCRSADELAAATPSLRQATLDALRRVASKYRPSEPARRIATNDRYATGQIWLVDTEDRIRLPVLIIEIIHDEFEEPAAEIVPVWVDRENATPGDLLLDREDTTTTIPWRVIFRRQTSVALRTLSEPLGQLTESGDRLLSGALGGYIPPDRTGVRLESEFDPRLTADAWMDDILSFAASLLFNESCNGENDTDDQGLSDLAGMQKKVEDHEPAESRQIPDSGAKTPMPAQRRCEVEVMAGGEVFLSYTWSDLELAVRIEQALEKAGISVFRHQDEPITARLVKALDTAKVLLVVYSLRYPLRYACQSELTRAFLAGQREGDPWRRVLVVNPERDESHIEPMTLGDTGYLSAREGLDVDQLVEGVRAKVRAADGPLGAARSTRTPRLPGRVLRSRRFVGRYQAMWRVHMALTARDATVHQPAASAAVVKGFTGTGKTWLAEQYAFLFQDAYPGGVFWSDFSGVRTDDVVGAFMAQLRAMAEGLGLGATGAEPERLRSMLAEHFTSQGEDVLWVLDDLPQGTRREQLDQSMLASPFVRVLATTQWTIEGWDGPVVDTVGLTELEGQELFGYDRTNLANEDRDAVSRLVRSCGGHPLALAATSAWLRNSQGGSGEHFAAVLDAACGGVKDVLRARVREVDPAARTVLTAAATLSAAPFTEASLVRALGSELGANVEQVVVDALGALDDRCLVQRLDRVGWPVGRQSWQLHALVADAVRQEIGTLDAHACAALAEALLEQLAEGKDAASHVHARELADRDSVPSAMRGRLLRAVAEFHDRHGDVVSAENAAVALLALKDDPDVDDLLLGARTAFAAGGFRRTLDRGDRALKLADHDRNFRAAYQARFLLAQAHDQLGEYAQADQVFDYQVPEWLPQAEQHLVKVGRATSLRLRGRVPEARDVLTALVPELPHESPRDVLTGSWPLAALELARLQIMTSAVAEALQISAEVIAAYQNAGAGEHPNCRQAIGLRAEAELLVVLNETSIRRAEGDCAVPEIAELHAEHARHHGEDNSVTLNFAVLQGRALLREGQPQRALEVLTEAEPRIVRVLGAHQPLHHRARYGMAQAHLQQHNWDRARFLLEDLLPRQVATLGRHHVDSLITRQDLGTCLAITDGMSEAWPLLTEAARELRRQFGWREPSLRVKVSRLYAQLPRVVLRRLVWIVTRRTGLTVHSTQPTR